MSTATTTELIEIENNKICKNDTFTTVNYFIYILNKGSGYIYITLVTKKMVLECSIECKVVENPNFQLVFEMLF